MAKKRKHPESQVLQERSDHLEQSTCAGEPDCAGVPVLHNNAVPLCEECGVRAVRASIAARLHVEIETYDGFIEEEADTQTDN